MDDTINNVAFCKTKKSQQAIIPRFTMEKTKLVAINGQINEHAGKKNP